MFQSKTLMAAALAAAGMLAGGAALAQTVQVEDAWARATVPGQKGGGAYMTLTAKADSALVGASTPVAETAEVHEMRMEGDVMRMRRVPEIALPAGQAVVLDSGGYHVMLMGLKQQLEEGSSFPLTLELRGADGAQSELQIDVPVHALAGGSAQDHHEHHGNEHEHHSGHEDHAH